MRADIERWTGGRIRPPRTGLRIGPQAAPLVVIAAVWGAGTLAAAVPGTLGWTVLVWTGLTLTAGLPGVRRTTIAGSPARRRARRHLLIIIGGGAGWLALAASVGPVGWPTVLLIAGGYAAAAPWWARRHIPIPGSDPDPEPEPEPDPEIDAPDWTDLIPAAWAETLAANGRVLAGSRLTEQGTAPTGVTWTIRLAPGRQSTRAAIDASPLIASGLGLSLDRVTVDNPPGREEDRAQLLITDADRNPLRQIHPYPGVRHAFDQATGTVRIGVYPDLARATVQVYRPGFGALGGIVIGSSGAGKSRLLELLGLSCQYNDVLVWVGDPQGGSSLPGLLAAADWPATTPDEIELQLEAATDLVTFRTKINGLYPRSTHPISAAAPMVLLIIDECHKVLTQGSRAAALADGLAREERKGGVGLWLATQYPGVSSFGDIPALRANLAAFNTIALRTGSQAGGMLPSLQLDPSTLPAIPGVGYTGGDDTRVAPFRGHYEEDDVVAALAAAAPRGQLEPAVLAMLGEGYRDRHHRRAATKAQLAAEIAAFDPDLVAMLAAADPALAAALDKARARPKTSPVPAPRTPASSAPAPGLAAAPTLTLGLLDIPAAPDFGSAPTTPAAAGAQPHPVLRTPSAHTVYQLVRDGVVRKGDLITRSGLSETQTRKALTLLADAGLVTKAAHGTWTPATPTERTPTS